MLKSTFSALAITLFSAQAFAGPVNVNTANAEELAAELNGVGPVTAARIIEYRGANGPFVEAAQLTQVRGIGERTVEKNQAFIQLQ